MALSVFNAQPNPSGAASADDAAQNYPQRIFSDVLDAPKIALRPPDDPTEDTTVYGEIVRQLARMNRSLRIVAAPWLSMPPDGESFHQVFGIALPAPAPGTFVPVGSITVPPGRNGVLNRIANVCISGGFTDFSGSVTWRILRNPGSGIAAAERNYENITASLGSVSNPAKIAPIRIFENDVIELDVQNVSIVLGAGQFIGGLFGGWFYPRTWDDEFERMSQREIW